MNEHSIILKEKKETTYDFSIGYRGIVEGAFSMPKIHYHANYEIHYLIEGKRTLLLNNQLHHFNKGELLFIHSNDMHRLMSREETSHQRFMIEFKMDYLTGIMEASGMMGLDELLDLPSQIVTLSKTEQKNIKQIMQSIQSLSSVAKDGQTDNGDGEMVRSLFDKSNYKGLIKFKLIELLMIIRQRAMTTEGYEVVQQKNRNESQGIGTIEARAKALVKGRTVDRKTLHDKIPLVIDYVHQHYMEPLTVDGVCEIFYISKSYFCLLFKEMTGISFVQYLNEVRIREAKERIASREGKISEIAVAVGYNSSTHFGRIFKQVEGCTPMSFKKDCRILE